MSARQRVFISYRHAEPDEALAIELARLFEAAGVDVLIDTKMRPGEVWPDWVPTGIQESGHFVVLLSERSIVSEMVIEEVRLAHLQRRRNSIKILPVLIGDLSDLPYDLGAWLNRLQRIRWRQGDDPGELANSLVGAILGQADLPLAGADGPLVLNPAGLGSVVAGGAPLPSADPRFTMEAGAMSPASSMYVRRDTDARIERDLSLPVARTITVRGPRQSGKSSLLARVRQFAQSLGQRTLYLDFQGIDGEYFNDLARFTRHLGRVLADGFATARSFGDAHDPDAGARENLRRFVQREVLPAGRTVLIFDEVDRVFGREWRTEFFAELRHWHNCRATIGPPWDSLTLVLGHSTDPLLWIDPGGDQSPFNVADLKIWLEDFDEIELAELNRRHGSPLAEVVELRRVFGGHPFLARLALYTLRTENLAVSDLAERALLPKNDFSGHLRKYLLDLRRSPELTRAVRSILDRQPFRDEEAFDKLYSLGLVTGGGPSDARLRCELYERFLADKL